jgi:hypothetical protein
MRGQGRGRGRGSRRGRGGHNTRSSPRTAAAAAGSPTSSPPVSSPAAKAAASAAPDPQLLPWDPQIHLPGQEIVHSSGEKATVTAVAEAPFSASKPRNSVKLRFQKTDICLPRACPTVDIHNTTKAWISPQFIQVQSCLPLPRPVTITSAAAALLGDGAPTASAPLGDANAEPRPRPVPAAPNPSLAAPPGVATLMPSLKEISDEAAPALSSLLFHQATLAQIGEKFTRASASIKLPLNPSRDPEPLPANSASLAMPNRLRGLPTSLSELPDLPLFADKTFKSSDATRYTEPGVRKL